MCALWSHAGKELTSWLSFVVSTCEFVTLPLVSWVRCGCWLVGFVALRPKSTAMVIAGRSVHLTTLFPGQA